MNLEYNIVKMEEQVTKLKSEIASMKKQLEQQDKLELKGGEGYFISTLAKSLHTPHADKDTITRGAFRATIELAEIADKNMVTRNRLEAYVHQIQGDGEGTHYVFFNKYTKMYLVSLDSTIHARLTEVYMTKKTAEILCKALNEGEIEL